jgi:hypothetical protein
VDRPQPLLPLDGYLDFTIKNHHDQQQEDQMCGHLVNSGVEPAGEVPPAFQFWRVLVNPAFILCG